MLITTIVARNYLAQARVLAGSFLRHHPDGRVVVLVLDATSPDWRDDEPFAVLTPEDLPIERRELRRMTTIYDVMELATALKPFLLRFLVGERGEATATYLDPDIEVFAPLDDIAALAEEHGVVLTPHRLDPMPLDDRGPIELVLVQAGAYNLGFVSVSAGGRPFLDWWAQRCRRDCLRAMAEGLFVDQRWVDLATAYFRHHVLRDQGCNVAYWNLDGRPVRATGEGSFTAGGVPLRFFHYSAFDPDEPHVLSYHQGPRPRVLLSGEPAVGALCAAYSARLYEAGWAECRKLDYGLDRAANDVRLDLTMRRLFREELLRRELDADRFGDPGDLPDPYEPAGADRFVALMRSPAPGTEWPLVSRYLEAVYVARPHLQRSFPDLRNLGGNHFLCWLRQHGHHDLGIPVEMIPAEDDLYPLPPRPAPPSGLPTDGARGVRVVGYLDADLGVGEGARGLVAALEAVGERVSVVAERETANRQRHPGDGAASDPVKAETDLDLVCVNADRLPVVLDRLRTNPARRRYTIGMWAWEVEDFPAAWAPAADLVDEIWVNSGHAALAIERALGRRVHVVVPPVIDHLAPPVRSRADLGLPDGFLFLFCFDFHSVMERKNPLGVVDAFGRAFAPGEGPQLVLKSINGQAMLTELERLRIRAADRPDVHVIDAYLDTDEQRALMAASDAYVSLHRAEGFGYTMAEAMLAGKPVIATGYSGNLEFMDERNSFLVGYRMTDIPEGCEPYPAGSRWAEPDLDEAAAAMRLVVGDPARAREVAERGRRTIHDHHTPTARAPLLAARLAASRAAAAERALMATRGRPLARRFGRRVARRIAEIGRE